MHILNFSRTGISPPFLEIAFERMSGSISFLFWASWRAELCPIETHFWSSRTKYIWVLTNYKRSSTGEKWIISVIDANLMLSRLTSQDQMTMEAMGRMQDSINGSPLCHRTMPLNKSMWPQTLLMKIFYDMKNWNMNKGVSQIFKLNKRAQNYFYCTIFYSHIYLNHSKRFGTA